MMSRCLMMALSLALVPVATAHALDLRLEAGAYAIHNDRDTGPSIGAKFAKVTRRHVTLAYGLTRGIGDEGFTSAELEAEADLPLHRAASLFAGVGSGLTLEAGRSLAQTGYALAGAEIAVAPTIRIRLGVRRGGHINYGDEGDGDGPHLYTLGFMFEL